ncbi:MAG: MBL fold metallo-hydrolase [Anaerolineae bacterium]|nr:MBL fold metallo-hydrolase [Anaerolineae bacterium]
MPVHPASLAFIVISLLGLSGCATSRSTTQLDVAPVDPAETVIIGEELSYRHIREDAYIITHSFPWPANSLLVEMANASLVLVDTPYTPEATKSLLNWATDRFGAREVIAINTGYHVDNLGGNQYLIEQGIPVYGSTTTARLVNEKGEQTRTILLEWLEAPDNRYYRDAHAAIPYSAPTNLFDLEEGLKLQIGNEMVQVYYPGPTHAVDNVVVYFPSKKLLFGGCMILSDDKPGYTGDADMQAWPLSIRKLEQFNCDILVPGHGDRYDPELLRNTLDTLEKAK